ncbi:MAG: hypothetical protein KFW07_00260, partial [Mycoplasmataceae bacterium]|nr:hypothetical protein [Mycoplasmataceae bacterium]
MEEFLEIVNIEIMKASDTNAFDVIRLMVAPILSLITAAMAISVFSATYFIVFRIKKYLTKHKNYLNFTNRLLTSIQEADVAVFRAYETTMWGEKLDNNKQIIGTVLSKYKSADLKDLILGTYSDELNSVKNIINKDSKLIKNNGKFIKFQKLFHIYTKDGIIVEYFNEDYISFYKVRKSGVTIGIIKKNILIEKGIDIKYNIDYSSIFDEELKTLASIYKIFFIKRTFVFKNISNPIQEFDEKMVVMKKTYGRVLKKKYSHSNVYLKDNFKKLPQLSKMIENDKLSIDGDLLLEPFNQKTIYIEKVLSDKIKNRKEIKEVKNKKGK